MKPLSHLGTVVLLVACAKGTPETRPVPVSSAAASTASVAATASSAAVPADPARCIPRIASTLVHVEYEGERGLACYATGAWSSEASCVEFDVATGVVTATRARKPTPPSPPEGKAVVTKTSDAISVCRRDTPTDCATIKVKALSAAANEEGTRLFALVVESHPGAVIPWALFADVYETKTGKRLAHHKLTSTLGFTSDENVYDVIAVGKNAVVRDYIADRTEGLSALLDAATGRYEPIYMGEGSFTKVRGNVWAAAGERRLAFWDVDAVRQIGPDIVAPDGKNPTEHRAAAIALGATNVLFAYSSPPGFMLVDLATKKPGAPHELAVCP